MTFPRRLVAHRRRARAFSPAAVVIAAALLGGAVAQAQPATLRASEASVIHLADEDSDDKSSTSPTEQESGAGSSETSAGNESESQPKPTQESAPKPTKNPSGGSGDGGGSDKSSQPDNGSGGSSGGDSKRNDEDTDKASDAKSDQRGDEGKTEEPDPLTEEQVANITRDDAAARAAALRRQAEARARAVAEAAAAVRQAEASAKDERAAFVKAKAARAKAAKVVAAKRQQSLSAILEHERVRRELGNLARLAYTSGPSELATISGYLDSESPSELMRQVALIESLANRRDTEWDLAVAKAARAREAVARASERLAARQVELDEAAKAWDQAQAAVKAARALLELRSQTPFGVEGAGSGTGAASIASTCGDAAYVQCVPSIWGESKLTRDAIWLMRTVAAGWPQIGVVGGWRPTDPYPDHPSGRAVDIMIPNYRWQWGVELGDEIATYFMNNADRYGIDYMIWRQRIWRAGSEEPKPIEAWRQMSNRGGDTANHLDHIHISVTTGVSGTAAEEFIKLGLGGPPDPEEAAAARGTQDQTEDQDNPA